MIEIMLLVIVIIFALVWLANRHINTEYHSPWSKGWVCPFCHEPQDTPRLLHDFCPSCGEDISKADIKPVPVRSVYHGFHSLKRRETRRPQ